MIDSKSYGLQTETRQYLRRLYSYGRELAGADIVDIDNFIGGLKQLNLWQNIVCWPMRRQHNVGTSATILSLGGLGAYNATAFQSPTWDSTGIIFNGTNQYIEFITPSQIKTTTLAGLTMFASLSTNTANVGKCIIGSQGGGTSLGPSLFAGASPSQGTAVGRLYIDTYTSATQAAQGSGVTGGITGVMETVCGGWIQQSRGIFLEYNNTARVITIVGDTSGSIWNNNTTWNIGRRVPAASSYFFVGTIPFCLIANRPITRTEYESLRDLHKTTIGKGLGLP